MKGRTLAHYQRADGQEKQIDGLFFGFDLRTDLVDVLHETGVAFDKDVFSFWVELFQFLSNAVRCFLGSTDEICSRLLDMFGELLECCLADATGATNKDTNKACW